MSSDLAPATATTTLIPDQPLWERPRPTAHPESERAIPAKAEQLPLFELELIAEEELSQVPTQVVIEPDSACLGAPSTLSSGPSLIATQPRLRPIRRGSLSQPRPKQAWPAELVQPCGYAVYGFAKIEAATNCRRSYQITYQPSLFAEHVIQRIWGRLGSLKQRTLEQEFASREEALRALARAVKRRLARGYELQWAQGQTENEQKEQGVA